MMRKQAIPLAALVAILAGCGRGGRDVADGERALAAGEFKKAASIFSAATKAHPSSVPLFYNLGVARALAGDSTAAIAAFRDVLRFVPGDLDASEALAAELRKTGSPAALSEAHDLLEFVLPYRDAAGDRARTLNTLALVEEALRRDDLALARLLAARAAAPDYPVTDYNLGKLCADRLKLPGAAAGYLDAFLAAPCATPAGMDAAAKAKALRASPAATTPASYSHAAAPEAAALAAQGTDAYSRRDYTAAERLFADAIAADPLALDAIVQRANALLALKRNAEAAEAFTAASALDPARFDIAFTAARLVYAAGDYARAAALLAGAVIPRWPDEPQPLLFATYAYAQQKRYYEARAFGELYLAAEKRANPKAKTSDVEAWLAKLPDTRFKP